jgi:flagellin-specific chaperone FliS
LHFSIFNPQFSMVIPMLASYLENEIFSATPQKLRLMLVDGALRFARLTIEHWRGGQKEAGAASLTRCREVVIELISSVRISRAACELIVDQTPGRRSNDERERSIESLHQIAQNTAAVYLIILRDLNEAQLHHDVARIEAAIRVLQIERETLQLVCQQLPHAPATSAGAPQSAEVTSTHAAALLAGKAGNGASGPLVYGDAVRPRGSLSLDG